MYYCTSPDTWHLIYIPDTWYLIPDSWYDITWYWYTWPDAVTLDWILLPLTPVLHCLFMIITFTGTWHDYYTTTIWYSWTLVVVPDSNNLNLHKHLNWSTDYHTHLNYSWKFRQYLLCKYWYIQLYMSNHHNFGQHQLTYSQSKYIN